MKFFECLALGHGRVESDLVKNGPVGRVVLLELLDSMLGTAYLGIDPFGRNIDSPYDIHCPEVVQEVVLDFDQIVCVDRAKLVKRQSNVVFGGWVRGPLDMVAHKLGSDFGQSNDIWSCDMSSAVRTDGAVAVGG